MVRNEELRKITDLLLDPELHYDRCRDAALSLYQLFRKLTAFREDETAALVDMAILGHLNTPGGLAVGTYSAAICTIDFLRTRNFLQAIHEAIEDRLREEPSRPIRLVYAGTGPFATLVTPLLTRFSPEQLQLTLLEINPVSMNLLQKLVCVLGAEDHVSALIQEDAAHWQLPASLLPDIIVSETMKPGLEKEPQVSIMTNLLKQCPPHTRFIPEAITIRACLYGNLSLDRERILELGTLLELDSYTARLLATDPGKVPVFSTGKMIHLPSPADPAYTRLGLLTHIRLYGHHELMLNASSLTIPLKLADMNGSGTTSGRLLFRYINDEKPGFRYEPA